MPIYVYECDTCGKVSEIEQRITEDALTDCECGGRIKRIIQPVGVAFKGSGFYVNDVAKPASAAPAAKPKEKSADKPAETKTPDTPKSQD